MRRSGFIGGVVLIIAFVLGLVTLSLCTTKVDPGYVAVQYDMNGGIRDDVLSQGWHITSPTIKTKEYTIGIEQSYLTAGSDGDSKDDESFYASSSEGKAIKIDLTYTYQYKPEDVVNVFTSFKGQSGKEIRDSFIKPNIVSWVKEVVARYKVAEVIGAERASINNALTEYLSEKFAAYGITVSNVSLIDVSVDEETMNAINAKIKAQQDAETQKTTNDTNRGIAQAEADIRMTEAKARAEATLIEAQAQAEANRLLAQSLTPELVEKFKLEKWDGKLPTVTSEGSAVIIGQQAAAE